MAALPAPRTALHHRTRPATSTSVAARSAKKRVAPAPAPFMTVYLSEEGGLHHGRCRRLLDFRGIRAELEADFYCMTCHEHVTLTKYAVSDIPIEGRRDNVRRLPIGRQ